MKSALLPSTFRRATPLLAGIALAVCVAPTASALRIDFSEDSSGMRNAFVEITREARDQSVAISIFGGGAAQLRSIHHTIDFLDGPVLLTDIDYAGASATDAAGRRRGGFVPRFIDRAKITTIDLAGVRARLGLHVDIPASSLIVPPGTPQTPGAQPAPGNPVPEPGAALLFGAGLLATGIARKR